MKDIYDIETKEDAINAYIDRFWWLSKLPFYGVS